MNIWVAETCSAHSCPGAPRPCCARGKRAPNHGNVVVFVQEWAGTRDPLQARNTTAFFVYEGFEQFSLPPSKLDLNHRLPIGSKVVPFLGLPCRILNLNHKKELLWSLWVDPSLAAKSRPSAQGSWARPGQDRAWRPSRKAGPGLKGGGGGGGDHPASPALSLWEPLRPEP